MLRSDIIHLSSQRGSWSSPLKDHNGTIRAVKFGPDDLSSDGSTPPVLASTGAGDFRPRLWDITTGSEDMRMVSLGCI